MCGRLQCGREEVQFGQHIVDAIRAEGDADAGDVRQAEDARQVVVATATGDGTDLCVQGFNFEDGTGVVVQTASQTKVQVNGES